MIYLKNYNLPLAYATVKIDSARSMTITTNKKILYVDGKTPNILRSRYDTLDEILNEDLFTVGLMLNDYKVLYNFKFILELIEGQTYKLVTDKVNKSTIFLLPLIDQIFVNSLLYNLYVYRNDSEYKDSVFLKYRYLKSDQFNKFENLLLSNPNVINFIDKDEFIVVEINTKKISSDIRYFEQGKYTKISEKSKQKILKSLDNDADMNDILYATSKRRQQLELDLVAKIDNEELFDVINKTEETFYG